MTPSPGAALGGSKWRLACPQTVRCTRLDPRAAASALETRPSRPQTRSQNAKTGVGATCAYPRTVWGHFARLKRPSRNSQIGPAQPGTQRQPITPPPSRQNPKRNILKWQFPAALRAICNGHSPFFSRLFRIFPFKNNTVYYYSYIYIDI